MSASGSIVEEKREGHVVVSITLGAIKANFEPSTDDWLGRAVPKFPSEGKSTQGSGERP
jgi:hypothetical protein